MAYLSEILKARESLSPIDVEWLHLLVVDWQVVADLAFADLVLWVEEGDSFVAVAHCRPSTGITLHQEDIVGQKLDQGRVSLMRKAMTDRIILHSTGPHWTGSHSVREDLVPVICNGKAIAVMSRESDTGLSRMPSRLEVNYRSLADDLCGMICRGEFPQASAPGRRRGGPRVVDGVVRIDVDGVVNYASPNAMSCFHRLGIPDPVVGKGLASSVTSRIELNSVVDESLPLVLMGRAAWQSEVESAGVALSMRSIPLTEFGQRRGALIIVRDVSELRLRERELMSKDATIREIHHRVKNNLQTVSALLRLQSRRSESQEVKDALAEAQRRVATIAVVHEALSQTADEVVDFDELLSRMLSLAADVARTESGVTTVLEGSIGRLPSSVATTLAIVITELISNAIEHGLNYSSGTVTVRSRRSDGELELHIIDDGVGVDPDLIGKGLGTQIVRTLVTAELRGSIAWENAENGGTDVVVKMHVE